MGEKRSTLPAVTFSWFVCLCVTMATCTACGKDSIINFFLTFATSLIVVVRTSHHMWDRLNVSNCTYLDILVRPIFLMTTCQTIVIMYSRFRRVSIHVTSDSLPSSANASDGRQRTSIPEQQPKEPLDWDHVTPMQVANMLLPLVSHVSAAGNKSNGGDKQPHHIISLWTLSGHNHPFAWYCTRSNCRASVAK